MKYRVDIALLSINERVSAQDRMILRLKCSFSSFIRRRVADVEQIVNIGTHLVGLPHQA